MLTSRILRHPPRILRARLYTSKAASAEPKAVPERVTTGTHPTASCESAKKKSKFAKQLLTLETTAATRSSCPPNTILVGLNYLKDQPPVRALPDEEYPPWLWKLLDKSDLPDDGPGGQAEKRRLRKENRQRIRDQNFMKTQ
jgi:hypothetical protein